MTTRFRVHPHRNLLRTEEPRKWAVHVESWGFDPKASEKPELEIWVERPFREVIINVSVRSVVKIDPGCGCAIAFMEGVVDSSLIHEVGDTIIIG